MIVIFGGTGTLGNALAKIYHEQTEITPVTIISRCELKQKEMKRKFPKFKYIVGDIRDHHWKHMVKPTQVYNLAAMKHVDTAEDNTEYCFDVNVNGTINACKWAIDNHAEFYFMSTDKAVLPINAYGASKMMAEKFVLSHGKHVYRWGNVMGSRGSVLHEFKRSLLEENTVYITHQDMTRFWIHIDDAANFMVDKTLEKPGVYIPKMGAAKVIEVANCVAVYLGIKSFEVKFTGLRPGEKIHEVLESNHDWCYRSDDQSIKMSNDVLYKMVERVLSE